MELQILPPSPPNSGNYRHASPWLTSAVLWIQPRVFVHARQALTPQQCFIPTSSQTFLSDSKVWALSSMRWSCKVRFPHAVDCTPYHERESFPILQPSYSVEWPWRSRAVSLRRMNKLWWSIIINSLDLSDTSSMRKSRCSVGQNAQNWVGMGFVLQRASRKSLQAQGVLLLIVSKHRHDTYQESLILRVWMPGLKSTLCSLSQCFPNADPQAHRTPQMAFSTDCS